MTTDSLTPEQRILRARAAVTTSWANTPDRTERTRPAREAFLARFADQVDPDRVLPEAERARRAEHAKRAYFLRLAYRSSRAARRRRMGQS
jgi:hypothetical protein